MKERLLMKKDVFIIHYTDAKPWLPTYKNRLGDRWWFLLCSRLVRCIITAQKSSNRDLGALTVQGPYHTELFSQMV